MYNQIFHRAKPICTSFSGGYYYFRGRFTASCGSALLRVSANMQIVIYCNGRRIFTRKEIGFDFQRLYDEVYIEDALADGENLIAVLVTSTHKIPFALEIEQNGAIVCASSEDWLNAPEKAYIPTVSCRAKMTPAGREERFDARIAHSDWYLPGFDDSEWAHAIAVSANWKNMTRYTPDMMEERTVYPIRLCSMEAVRQADGVRLTSESPAGSGLSLYATYLTASCDTDFILRSQHDRYGIPNVSIDGVVYELGSEVHLSVGKHFLLVTKQGWLELLLENASLTASAEEIVGAPCEVAAVRMPEYSLHFNWNEEGGVYRFWPELLTLHTAKLHSELPERIVLGIQAGRQAANSSVAEVRWQHLLSATGCFFSDELAPAEERTPCRELTLRADGTDSLLHADGEMILHPIADGIDIQFIVDLGELLCGHIQLSMDAPESTVLDIQCFEMCDKTGPFYLYYPNGMRYIAREGEQRYFSPIRRGARYLSVTVRNVTAPVRIRDLSFVATQYKFKPLGAFRCNDEELNRIFDICVSTAGVCMLDTYVDCPTWEQNFWSGDCPITALVNKLNFGEYVYDQHCIDMIGYTLSDDYRRAQKLRPFDSADEPRLSSSKVNVDMVGGIPMWSFMLGLHIWEHHLATGNMEELSRNYGYLKKNMEIANWWVNERGLFDMSGTQNLIDWANNDLPPCGEITANNMAYAENLRIAARVADILGLSEESELWNERRNRLINAINAYCWDEEREAYVDTARDEFAYPRFDAYCRRAGLRTFTYEEYLSCKRISTQTQTFAVLFDIVPEERLDKVMRIVRLVDDGVYICGAPRNRTVGEPGSTEAKDGIVRIGSPFFLHYSFAALCKQQEYETVMHVIKQVYGEMLSYDAVTTFEMFDISADPRAAKNPWIGLPNRTRSAAHGWSASPAIYLQRDILGVKPLSAGYRTFTVTPHLCGLTEISGAICTPYGEIQVEVRTTDSGKYEIVCKAPEECKYVPTTV